MSNTFSGINSSSYCWLIQFQMHVLNLYACTWEVWSYHKSPISSRSVMLFLIREIQASCVRLRWFSIVLTDLLISIYVRFFYLKKFKKEKFEVNKWSTRSRKSKDAALILIVHVSQITEYGKTSTSTLCNDSFNCPMI
jgi:hypothetical protein